MKVARQTPEPILEDPRNPFQNKDLGETTASEKASQAKDVARALPDYFRGKEGPTLARGGGTPGGKSMEGIDTDAKPLPLRKRWSEVMWQRHRHPASGWTRYLLAVLLGLAIWYHEWPAIAIVALGVITNPFWFPPPKTDRSFMTRAVDGERIWLARASFREKFLLMGIPSLQIVPLIWALWMNEPVWTTFFAITVLGGKTAFLVWTAEIAEQY